LDGDGVAVELGVTGALHGVFDANPNVDATGAMLPAITTR
jgi:hypothetical protein